MGANILLMLGVEFIKAIPAIITAIGALRKRNKERKARQKAKK